MNKEQKELVDEAYENWLMNTKKMVDKEILKKFIQHTPNIHKEEFINKCKNNKDFSEKWGLTIEERELRQFERVKLLHKAWKNNGITPEHKEVSTLWVEYKNLMEKYNIPTQIIIVTYQDQKIESYE